MYEAPRSIASHLAAARTIKFKTMVGNGRMISQMTEKKNIWSPSSAKTHVSVRVSFERTQAVCIALSDTRCHQIVGWLVRTSKETLPLSTLPRIPQKSARIPDDFQPRHAGSSRLFSKRVLN